MTEKTLIVICIALLLLVVLLLLVLISRKPKSAQNGNDTGIDAVKEKLDKLGGVADYTNKAITSLGSMTEYRLNNIQKTVSEQLRIAAGKGHIDLRRDDCALERFEVVRHT